ncbi:hypothetical protein COEREDRAFT_11143 [Coemansia reversa NRRL 1564]|uniref:Zn(2)-C6 fungal-type domain-containing protein n=1 Tax=Coemansia reversa (strain ATCC 12441 / NRRL 1564) TaxID=763665 RepID=A0A2G5B3R2_COERN|nr:hypothetical protein COEREDRAFT_11143 [Coemansia reversa NRRL 1564]|eukprot:PIA13625.1 hypothetical protein COEREDRAFT_11143 [Coemansia reversa NRRL 1564]
MASTKSNLQSQSVPSSKTFGLTASQRQHQRPSPDSDSDDNSKSSSETPTRAKRAQVKNACVNCQKACKKCDPGRPCQRCIKYSLIDTCVDSKRKPRKRGIKRGPYKKRKRNPEDSAGTGAGSTAAQPLSPGTAAGEYSLSELTTLPPKGLSTVSVSAAASTAHSIHVAPETGHSRSVHRTGSITRRQRLPHIADNYTQRVQRPRILGPGAIPILHADSTPEYNDYSEDSSSDVPLVMQQTRDNIHAYRAAEAVYERSHPGIHPDTPTSGLSTAFRSLATTHHQHIAESHLPHTPGNTAATGRISPYVHHPIPSFTQTQSGAGSFRLPPIESFDQAHALTSPPSTSSLSILTDVALGHSSTTTARPEPTTSQQPPQPPIMHPPLPRLPSQHHQTGSADDIGQESQTHPPEDSYSRHNTPACESELSTNFPSSFDSRNSDTIHARSTMRRLSHRLKNTHIEQEPADL